jgi:hypothetical protein
MKVDCFACGGSGGGDEPALRCPLCRGRGQVHDDRAQPCCFCGEPAYDGSDVCADCYERGYDEEGH